LSCDVSKNCWPWKCRKKPASPAFVSDSCRDAHQEISLGPFNVVLSHVRVIVGDFSALFRLRLELHLFVTQWHVPSAYVRADVVCRVPSIALSNPKTTITMYRPWTNIMSNPAASKSVASGAEASAISATGDTSHSTSAVAVPVNCNVVLTMVSYCLPQWVIQKLTKHQAIKRLELREIEGIPMVNRIAVLLDPTKYIDYFDRYGKPGADSLFDGLDLWIVEKWCAWYCDLLESRDCANATIKPADNRKCWDPKAKKKKELAQLWGPEWTRDIDPSKWMKPPKRPECMHAN
jgi:hypothetical protein